MMNLNFHLIHTLHAGFSVLLTAFLGTIALIVPHQSASASPLVYARASSTVTGGDNAEQTASSGSVTDVYTGDTDIGATATGRTEASFFPLLRAYATTELTSGGSFSSRFTSSIASFRDDFLFDKPGMTGTAGTVVVRFTIDGTLSAVANGAPTSSVSAHLNNTWAEARYGFGVGIDLNATTKSQRLYGDGRQTGTPFLDIQQEFILNFTYGVLLENVTLHIGALNAATAQFTNYTTKTTADLENTAKWGGFGDVRDANGNLLTDYTFSSTSGTNYVVPEPGTTLLFLASVCALSVVRLRRRRTGSA